jgi:hypothetical protein
MRRRKPTTTEYANAVAAWNHAVHVWGEGNPVLQDMEFGLSPGIVLITPLDTAKKDRQTTVAFRVLETGTTFEFRLRGVRVGGDCIAFARRLTDDQIRRVWVIESGARSGASVDLVSPASDEAQHAFDGDDPHPNVPYARMLDHSA